MTFFSRMTTETGSPMPRWLYLLDKAGHTALLTLLLWRLTPLSITPAAAVSAALYVGVGLGLWYKGGIHHWFGPGSITGDLIYHWLPSLLVVILTLPNRLESACYLVATLIAWWLLDTAGYGPSRSTPES